MTLRLRKFESVDWCSGVKIWTKILLIASVPFLCFFILGVTGFGQRLLIGNVPAGIDHWEADDIYMGAGLAPWVYGLIPFYLLGGSGTISLLLGLRRIWRKRLN
jgi:hypothetical protein